MSNYYYLTAQLPFLDFSRRPEINREKFLNEARKWVNPSHISMLEGINIDDFLVKKNDPYVLREYKNFDYSIKKEVSLVRQSSGRETDYKISSMVKSVFAVDDPLEREKKLLRLRWEFVDGVEEGHYFDLDFLTAYFIKMQILEKLFTFDKNKGLAVFDRVCEVTGAAGQK